MTFDHGVAVGGYSHVTIREDGSFIFTGHFHDSGGVSYNAGIVWAIKDSQNVVYTFAREVRVTPGTRNEDWLVPGHSDDVASRWANIAGGCTAQYDKSASLSISALYDSFIEAIGIATLAGAVVIALA